MKIITVLGSPRERGNSAILARRVVEAAQARGAQADFHLLNRMAIKGCQGCNMCKTKQDHCVVDDDLAPVLEAIRTADALVMASPVYFGEISGQLKCFFDRTYSFLNPDFSSRLAPGKKAVFILTQGQPDESLYTDVFPRYDHWLKVYGFTDTILIRAPGVQEAGAVEQREAILGQADAAVHRLMS